ncbi:MAG: hypothetical protein QOH90_1406, partial [Actinomycetota bacterium]|nr:hypothetical protein [Actinomycetota bacterium]
MRIYRYASREGGFQPRVAVAVGDGPPIDLIRAWDEVTGTRLTVGEGRFLLSVVRLIEQGPEVWSEVRDVVRATSDLSDMQLHPDEEGFRILSPL